MTDHSVVTLRSCSTEIVWNKLDADVPVFQIFTENLKNRLPDGLWSPINELLHLFPDLEQLMAFHLVNRLQGSSLFESFKRFEDAHTI
jgi:hypothetical protein